MKKFLKVLLAAVVVTGLIGCSGGKPKDVSDDYYNVAVEALEATKSYLDGNLTQKEAFDEIEAIESKFPSKIDYNKAFDATSKEIDLMATVLEIILVLDDPVADKDEVTELYNKLKKQLNK